MSQTEELLNQVDRMVTKYVAFPSEHHSVVVALWILHTWVVNAFYVTPAADPRFRRARLR